MTNHSQKIRTPLELWLVVEENFDEYFESCLCGMIFRLSMEFIISDNEYRFLQYSINHYCTQRFYYWDSWDMKNNLFWKIGEQKPRRMFIQKQILKAIRA